MLEELDRYSKRIATQIFNRFPHWKEFASISEYKGDKALSVKVIPPSGIENNSLRINTFRQEVSVSFNSYHVHFGEFDTEEQPYALTLVNQLIAEAHCVVSYWRDEQWCGSILLPESDFPSTNSEYPYANKIKIQSWAGRLDREVDCIPKD